jgi:transcriptional regulator GlxA family with amidase domain
MLFKNKVGMSLGVFVRNARLHRAQNLLVNSDMSIKQIADECGCGTLASFSRMFTHSTGMNPRAYRKNPGVNQN